MSTSPTLRTRAKSTPAAARPGAPRTARRAPPIAPEWAWHYRTLLALRDHLDAETGDRARESCDAMEPPSLHPEDLFDELYDRELAGALPPERAAARREIADALHRLESGRYGVCEATGRRIPKARLLARPWCRYTAVAARRRGDESKPAPRP